MTEGNLAVVAENNTNTKETNDKNTNASAKGTSSNTPASFNRKGLSEPIKDLSTNEKQEPAIINSFGMINSETMKSSYPKTAEQTNSDSGFWGHLKSIVPSVLSTCAESFKCSIEGWSKDLRNDFFGTIGAMVTSSDLGSGIINLAKGFNPIYAIAYGPNEAWLRIKEGFVSIGEALGVTRIYSGAINLKNAYSLWQEGKTDEAKALALSGAMDFVTGCFDLTQTVLGVAAIVAAPGAGLLVMALKKGALKEASKLAPTIFKELALGQAKKFGKEVAGEGKDLIKEGVEKLFTEEFKDNIADKIIDEVKDKSAEEAKKLTQKILEDNTKKLTEDLSKKILDNIEANAEKNAKEILEAFNTSDPQKLRDVVKEALKNSGEAIDDKKATEIAQGLQESLMKNNSNWNPLWRTSGEKIDKSFVDEVTKAFTNEIKKEDGVSSELAEFYQKQLKAQYDDIAERVGKKNDNLKDMVREAGEDASKAQGSNLKLKIDAECEARIRKGVKEALKKFKDKDKDEDSTISSHGPNADTSTKSSKVPTHNSSLAEVKTTKHAYSSTHRSPNSAGVDPKGSWFNIYFEQKNIEEGKRVKKPETIDKNAWQEFINKKDETFQAKVISTESHLNNANKMGADNTIQASMTSPKPLSGENHSQTALPGTESPKAKAKSASA